MAKVFVTGATGCLGNYLSRYLSAQGHQVVAQGRDIQAARGLVAAGITFLPFDLRGDYPDAAFKSVDIIFHCAALSSAWGTAEAFQTINVTATQRLLSAATKAQVQKFVFASSPSIYANGKDRFNLSEEASLPNHFPSHYARTKYEAECLVMAADQQNGMRTTAIRPRAIYGAGDRSLMPRLLEAIQRGRVPMINGGESLIDITHVTDAARAMSLAGFKNEVGGEIFNITSGVAFRFSELLAAVCALKNAKPREIHIKYESAMRLAKSLEFLHRIFMPAKEPVITCQAVASLGRSLTLDISKAKTLLGYVPMMAMEDGIRDYANSL
ncbi:NAD-dependent epimerase/dehydratase family protein [Paenochrobactrum pullorum]|uniref:NAD-dependent epimerase/dehydratase family protein n=1 Tax=Paenochrobactrum pullorum TaxID=1324351 RepID=UPI0035BC1691